MIEPPRAGWPSAAALPVLGTAPMLMLNSRGKRFMNEGAIAQMQATCLRQPAGLACYVTDANWAKTLKLLRWTTAHPTWHAGLLG